jgi:hypothetical protein
VRGLARATSSALALLAVSGTFYVVLALALFILAVLFYLLYEVDRRAAKAARITRSTAYT